jgi:hypothetical protein
MEESTQQDERDGRMWPMRGSETDCCGAMQLSRWLETVISGYGKPQRQG